MEKTAAQPVSALRTPAFIGNAFLGGGFFRKAASLALLLAGALAILQSTMLRAAEAPASEPQETREQPADSPNSTGSERRQAGDKGGVFRPTEDISEDAAITFPVDI